MPHCGVNSIKYTFYGLNVVFAIYGLGILITGAIALAEVDESDHFMESKITLPSTILIITGVTIILIVCLGCLGAIRESSRLLLVYATLLVIILIVELAGGIAACVLKKNLETLLKNSFQDSIVRSSNEDMVAWNNIQEKLMCCGAESPVDWRTMSPNRTLPVSCCHPGYIDEIVGHCRDSPALSMDKYYQKGCMDKLKEYLDKNAATLIVFVVFVVLVQISVTLLACVLVYIIRHKHKRYLAA